MRTAFCNWGTSTGRLSSRDPNLQNIPRNHFILTDKILTDEEKENLDKRIKSAFASKGQNISTTLSPDVLETWAFVGDESYDDLDDKQVAIRRLFISRPNYTLVAFDYSQMEVRVFLSYFRNEITDALLNSQTNTQKHEDKHEEIHQEPIQPEVVTGLPPNKPEPVREEPKKEKPKNK